MVYGTFHGNAGMITTEKINQTHAGQSLAFRYIVEQDDTLEVIARKTHRQPEDLYRLNSHLFNGTRHPKVYVGQALVIDEPGSLSLPPPPALIDDGWGQMHVVTSSDTLDSIAQAYNTSEDAIRSDNRQYFPVGERRAVFPGQMLHIRQINTVATGRYIEQPEYYSVGPSDTFETIAGKTGMSIQELLDCNRVQFPRGSRLELHPSMKLIVRGKKPKVSMRNIAEVVLTKQIHIVQEGDTPRRISEKYNMSMDQLREYNRAIFPKGYRGHIRAGHQLVVNIP